MRIALVSDIHGNLPALEAVVADIARRGVDRIVNLGDSLSGPLLPRETASYLMATDWIHLAGNHERALLSPDPAARSPADEYARAQMSRTELDWLARQSPCLRLSEEVFLCHGTPVRDAAYLLETVHAGCTRLASPEEIQARLAGETTAVVACGHTHVPRAVRTRAGQLIVNPGSVGLPAFDDEHPSFHVVETGAPDARYAIIEKRAGLWSAWLLTVPYDAEPMALAAGARGRPDWAVALRTGYMHAAGGGPASMRP